MTRSKIKYLKNCLNKNTIHYMLKDIVKYSKNGKSAITMKLVLGI